MPLPRVHGFEFCDQPWLAGTWREAYMDALGFLFRAGGIYRRMHGPFGRWARLAGGARVLDLASGGGGPIETLLRTARDARAAMPGITLSDLYPDLPSYRRLEAAFPGQVDYIAEPVDAVGPGVAGNGTRLNSICTGFHHFNPAQARRFLAGITERSDGLFVMEPNWRSWHSLFLPILTFLPLMLAPLFSRRFSCTKFLITMIVPVVPALIVFDGMASALRMYRPEEILAMVPEPARHAWHWEWGSHRCLVLFRATYLFGVRPVRNAAAEAPPAPRASQVQAPDDCITHLI